MLSFLLVHFVPLKWNGYHYSLTGFSGEWDAFSIYETGDNSTAILGQNWATQFNTPPMLLPTNLGKVLIWEMFLGL